MTGPAGRPPPLSPAGVHASLTSGRGFWIALTGYILLLFLLRRVLFPGASQDDAEQLILSQTLAGGYNPAQPPLYTWLIWGVSQIIGPGLTAVLIVKYTCLSALYAFLALAGREILRDGTDQGARDGRLAALGLLALLYVGYEIVFNYSNTVIMAAAAAATLYALARVVRGGSWAAFAGLGAAVGVGLLSKYGYGLFAGSLALAALTVAPVRRALLSPKLLLTAFVAAALLAPHAWWLATQAGDLSAAFKDRLVNKSYGYWLGVGRGVFKLGNGILVFLFPLILFAPLIFPRAVLRRTALDPDRDAWRRLLERFLLAVVLILLAAVVVGGMTNVRTHYMYVLIAAPIYLLLRARGTDMPDGRFHRFARGMAIMAVLWIAVLLGRYFIEARVQSRPYFHFPYPALAAELRKAGFNGRGTIVAYFRFVQIGGNLRAQFPNARVVSSKYPYYYPKYSAVGGGCLLVWHAPDREGPPAGLTGFARQIFGWRGPRNIVPRYISAPIPQSGGRKMTLGFVLLTGGRPSQCR
jgi:4-amino-4-deoxy-L-arabinose transferase-like glycosyltransferase